MLISCLFQNFVLGSAAGKEDRNTTVIEDIRNVISLVSANNVHVHLLQRTTQYPCDAKSSN
jgi:hypothetical protein